jgi:alkylmercury lyase-like protein
MSDPTTVQSYADAIAQAMPPLPARQLDLVLAAYRAMLTGRPSEIAAIAADAGWEASDAATQLEDWPGVFLDEANRVIGFWGLTVQPISTHLVTTESGSSWAWCALDPLFILALVGERGTVAARSGVTGKPVELEVAPDRASRISPDDDVYVSFLIPSGPFTSDVRVTFCDYVLFFAGKSAADQWTNEHPGTTALTLDDAAAIGRAMAERLRQAKSPQAA